MLPGPDLLAGIDQRREKGLVEKLVPEAFVEALDKAVLYGLSRNDVVPIYA